KLSSPRVRVVRDGRVGEIASEQVVPGDVMLLEAGVQVAADGRLLEESNLQIRESALTGEAHAVDKQVNVDLPEDTPLGDRLNLVYRGTEVVQGRATVLVTRTGMHTELGRIATMLESVETEETPLQRRMDQLGNVLVSSSLGLVALVVLIGILRQGWGVFEQLLEVSLSMAVAVVPEGLPAAITVTLALGTQRMVKRNALIRKLPAVETLGSVTVICSDKTGTLTQNKMVVQRVETENHSLKVTGEGYSPKGEFLAEESPIAAYDQIEVRSLLIASALCNDSILQEEEGQWKVIGDPTEGALLPLAAKAGIEKDQWASRIPRVDEFPFSSERKRMSVICQVTEGVADLPVLTGQPYVMFTKGSPELILERCSQVQTGDRAETLTEQQRSQILEANNQMAGKGLRVLGFALKSLPAKPASGSDETTERELVWLGLVGMLDAPRPEVRDAVARCRSAGIRAVMITGDHQLTAQAIAEDLGISQPGDRVLTGRDLEKLSMADLEREVLDVSIYARVAPEHKLKIVQALQRRNNIAAMTGDGVNDAPALKQADIGIAMGITGTDVSKEASDMVLLDDNFATIVAAAEEGRVVYTNIRRFIKYILGSNIGEVLVIASSPLLLPLGGGVPLTPLQILWMNLVTDGLPALALAVEPAEPNVMNRPPHNPNESIFSRGLGAYMVRIGIIFTVISISLMLWAFTHSHEVTSDILSPDRWKTMVFTTLCLAQLGHALAIRSNTQLFIEMNPFSNRWLLPTLLLTAVLQLCLIYLPPLRGFFGTHYLSPSELLVCFGFSSLMFFWVELEKLALRLYAQVSGKAIVLGD
ncbi:MAG: cation-transporting P-type ATPase, partial [Leptolyngbyaceae cyanobacterium bins.59]|nr:cation-transporting P-type ATPase [Leptolyngbyaceae cyanobacterium bins.59]